MSGELLLIAGCRNYDNFDHFCAVVDKYISYYKLTIQSILGGKASGIDDMAEDYAILRGYAFEGFDADWDNLGKSAGFVRNETMVSKSTAVLAFWDKKSPGTGDAVDRALKQRKFLTIIPIVQTKKRYYCARHRAEFAAQNSKPKLTVVKNTQGVQDEAA